MPSGPPLPSPFRACRAPSLSRREREKTAQPAKGEDICLAVTE
jgi:hypothetical protein